MADREYARDTHHDSGGVWVDVWLTPPPAAGESFAVVRCTWVQGDDGSEERQILAWKAVG